jgi:hypothetical protein
MTLTTRLASLLLLTSVSLAPACGGDDDDDDDGGSNIDAAVDEADAAVEVDASVTPDSGPDVDGGSEQYIAQIVERSCAPNDALAISIKLSSSVDAKTCTPNFFDPTLVVDIYVAADDIDAPATLVIDDIAEGAVQVCPGGKNGCLNGFTATVELDTFEDGEGATGTVTIRGEDSVYAEVELDADWCEPESGPITCG